MYKFISGAVNTGAALHPYLVLVLDNRKVTHVEMINELRLKRVLHAGYVDISEQGFLSFYGVSTSTSFKAEGIDVMEMNKLIKEHPPLQVDSDDIEDFYVSGKALLDTFGALNFYVEEDDPWTPLTLRKHFETNLAR